MSSVTCKAISRKEYEKMCRQYAIVRSAELGAVYLLNPEVDREEIPSLLIGEDLPKSDDCEFRAFWLPGRSGRSPGWFAFEATWQDVTVRKRLLPASLWWVDAAADGFAFVNDPFSQEAVYLPENLVRESGWVYAARWFELMIKATEVSRL